MSKKALILSIPMILAVFLLGGWFLSRGQKTGQESPKPPTVKENSVKPVEKPQEVQTPDTAIDTSDWKTYRNEEYGFEVKYPKEWVVDVQGEGREKIYSKNELRENPRYSMQFSFGPPESIEGGYFIGIFVHSSLRNSVDKDIQDTNCNDAKTITINGQEMKHICSQSDEYGENTNDRFIFEHDALVWNMFGGAINKKGSGPTDGHDYVIRPLVVKKGDVDSFFASFRFVQ